MTKEEDTMFSMIKASVAQLILRRAMKEVRNENERKTNEKVSEKANTQTSIRQ